MLTFATWTQGIRLLCSRVETTCARTSTHFHWCRFMQQTILNVGQRPSVCELAKQRKRFKREAARLHRRCQDHPAIDVADFTVWESDRLVSMVLTVQSFRGLRERWLKELFRTLTPHSETNIELVEDTRDGDLQPRTFYVDVWLLPTFSVLA